MNLLLYYARVCQDVKNPGFVCLCTVKHQMWECWQPRFWLKRSHVGTCIILRQCLPISWDNFLKYRMKFRNMLLILCIKITTKTTTHTIIVLLCHSRWNLWHQTDRVCKPNGRGWGRGRGRGRGRGVHWMVWEIGLIAKATMGSSPIFIDVITIE